MMPFCPLRTFQQISERRRETSSFSLTPLPLLLPAPPILCLPRKGFGFRPDLFTKEPLSTLDLNVEYKLPFGWELEEETVEKLEEEKGEAENGCNEEEKDDADDGTQIIENNREEKSQEIAGDGECNEEEEDDADDEIVCAVCQSTDGDPSDPIVVCDGCNLMVHASCYDNPLVKGIPEGDGYCAWVLSKALRYVEKARTN
ncbi:hypothetical protein DVH24_038799 [Malus domestica]|uniref:Zinc finger PHD-type domain-containing protein n=1 Tax=Malus domestica TaxID=3750 RepID=A0A498KFJ2_MALDO|nr:hypothetical protein DVH24_038799 [Malus domestica]